MKQNASKDVNQKSVREIIPRKRKSSSSISYAEPPSKKCNMHLNQIEDDFLCDRTVVFIESGDLKDIVSIELAENSLYFEKLLCHHVGKGAIPLPEFINSSFDSILEFIRTGKTTMNENIFNLYVAADFLLITKLKDVCINCIKVHMENNPALAINFWLSVKESYYPDLINAAFQNILYNFDYLIHTTEFLELSSENLKQIINDDRLNCKSEMDILHTITTWIRYSPETRLSVADKLFICIRIETLSDEEIEKMKQNEYISINPTIMHIIKSWPNCLNNPRMTKFISKQKQKLLNPRFPTKVILVFGGWCDGQGPKAASQVYDPQENSWTLWTEEHHSSESETKHKIGTVPRRVYAGCVLVNNKVYIIGGFDGNAALKTTICYDFDTDFGWYEISCMYERRYYVSTAYTSDFIYAVGGHNGEARGRLNTAERFSIKENLWNKIAQMHRVRSDASSAELLGRVYVCGGFEGRRYHDTAEYYNADINEWTLIGRMNSPRGGVSLIRHGDYLYALGGNNGTSRLRTIERYDSQTDTWEVYGEMLQQKSNLSSTVVDDDIYIIGGWSDEANAGILSTVEKFNVTSKRSVSVYPLCFSASATCSCTLDKTYLANKYLRRETQTQSRRIVATGIPGDATIIVNDEDFDKNDPTVVIPASAEGEPETSMLILNQLVSEATGSPTAAISTLSTPMNPGMPVAPTVSSTPIVAAEINYNQTSQSEPNGNQMEPNISQPQPNSGNIPNASLLRENVLRKTQRSIPKKDL